MSFACLVGMVVFLHLSAAHAEDAVQFNDKPPQPIGGMNEKVIGGKLVDNPSDWPATFYQVVSERDTRRWCTATLVGPRTMLLAAHCLKGFSRDLERRSKAAFKIRGDVTNARCEERPEYQNSITAENGGCTGLDLALCELEKEITVAGPYETINTHARRASPDTDVILLGYGCIKKGDYNDTSNPPIKPVLYQGVTKLGKSMVLDPDYIRSLDDVVLICQGDSGGAVYANDVGISKIKDDRIIVAVNSCNTKGRDNSFFVDTSAKNPRGFVLDWNKGKQVCGVTLNTDDGRCRRP